MAAFIAGLLLPLAYPPFHILPLFYVSFIFIFHLIWQIKDDSRSLFICGWLFGCGQFLVGFYWIGESFLVLGGVYLWLMPFAIGGLVAGLALFPALTFWLWGILADMLMRFNGASNSRLNAAILFVLLWSISEYARAHILTGLPWNLSGMAWAGFLPLAQMASLVGLFGMGFLCLLSAICFTVPQKKLWGVGLAIPLIAILFGTYSLQDIIYKQNTHKILVVQPNIKQSEKWLPEKRDAHIADIFALIKQGLDTHKDSRLIILPETAMPVLIDEDNRFAQLLRLHLPPDTYLLLGAVRRVPDNAQNKSYHYYNSAMLWNSEGRLLSVIDKYHLVPFGEYLPAQTLLESIGLRQLTQLRGGFATRKAAMVAPDNLFSNQDIPPFLPLICFEATFPYLPAAQKKDMHNNIEWLVNLTNDAWFGDSLGPSMHLAHARLRAIEQGKPLIRSANTGISAAFDAQGRILATLPLNQQGYFSVDLPSNFRHNLPKNFTGGFTFYSYWYDNPFWMMIFMMSIVITRTGSIRRLKNILQKA